MAAITWLNTLSDGNLGEAGNYSGNTLPGGGDTLTIATPAHGPPTTGISNAGAVTINNTAEIDGVCVFNGIVTVASGCIIGASIFNNTVKSVTAAAIHGSTFNGDVYINGVKIQSASFNTLMVP